MCHQLIDKVEGIYTIGELRAKFSDVWIYEIIFYSKRSNFIYYKKRLYEKERAEKYFAQKRKEYLG